MQQADGYTLFMTVPEHEFWKSVHTPEDNESHCVFIVKEVEPGIYLSDINFENNISSYTDFTVVDSYERLGKDGLPKKYEQGSSMNDYFENTIECYGIADNIEQVKERFKDQIHSDSPVVISVAEISKDNQPAEGGWRWHKWGEYIGTQNPQYEYIYDEPEIDSVYVFHIHAVKPKLELNLEKKAIIKPKI